MVKINLSLDDDEIRDAVAELIIESEEIFTAVRNALTEVDVEINLDLKMIIKNEVM